MIGVGWTFTGGRWHAVGMTDVKAGGVRLRCGGLIPASGWTATVSIGDDPLPPDPCHRCLMAIADDLAIDEPLDEAKARGFLPASPDPG